MPSFDRLGGRSAIDNRVRVHGCMIMQRTNTVPSCMHLCANPIIDFRARLHAHSVWEELGCAWCSAAILPAGLSSAYVLLLDVYALTDQHDRMWGAREM